MTSKKSPSTSSAGIEPYENVFIGNFLYGLGLALGAKLRGKLPPSCLSLLQQTPADTILGDVLAEFSGTVLLYEFKRSRGKDAKEHSKARDLRILMNHSPDLEAVSRAVHWYVVSQPATAKTEPQIHLLPYLDIGTDANAACQPLSQYVNELAELIANKDRPRIDRERIKAYLRQVAALSKGDQGAVGGMLVAVDSQGAIRYVVVDDIRDLGLDHSSFLTREEGRQQAREDAHEQRREQAAHTVRDSGDIGRTKPERDKGRDR